MSESPDEMFLQGCECADADDCPDAASDLTGDFKQAVCLPPHFTAQCFHHQFLPCSGFVQSCLSSVVTVETWSKKWEKQDICDILLDMT